MDNQSPSPNTPTPVERPAGVQPESLPVGKPAEAAPVEVATTPASGAPAAPVPVAAPPSLTAAQVVAAVAATPTSNAPASTSTPARADDVDVIEPEWVDKASEVVRAHQGDPYGEEEAIQELQEDYLQKRYGITVAEPDADNTKPKGA